VGYNWRGTLTDYSQISGVLAGFCLALIVFVLGWKVSDTIVLYNLTYGEVSVLIIGIAAGLYIAAMEFFLSAKGFDLWALSEEYQTELKVRNELSNEEWMTARTKVDETCERYDNFGRYCFNVAMFLIFLGISVVIAPFNFTIAIVVGVFGILLEVSQIIYFKLLNRKL
jgi:hypothetical protein